MSTESEKAYTVAMATDVPTEIEQPVIESLSSYYSTYWKKIRPMQEKLEGIAKPATESLSATLFQAAKKCQHEAGSDMEKVRILWKGLCAHAEEAIKIQAGKDGKENANNMLAIVPAWTSLKSTVTKFLEQKRDIFDSEQVDGKEVPRFASIADMRKAMAARGAQGKTSVTESGQVATAAGNLLAKGTEKLKGVIRALFAELTQNDADAQDMAATLLMGALAEIQRVRKNKESLVHVEASLQTGVSEVQAVAPAVAAAAKKEQHKRSGSRV